MKIMKKKEFKNQKLNDGKEDNFVKLNTKEDLYLKNLKEKGLDKEIIEENKGDEKKRKFNNNNQRTFYNKRDFKKPFTNNKELNPPKEVEYDSDGFEIIGSEKKNKRNQASLIEHINLKKIKKLQKIYGIKQ